jgi:hypothetical protein
VQIDECPPGLVSRSMSRRNGRVIIEEHWNIDTPGCPMIRNPWVSNPSEPGPHYVRVVEMSEAEYEAARPTLK